MLLSGEEPAAAACSAQNTRFHLHLEGWQGLSLAAAVGPAGNAWWQGMTFNNARQSITNVTINGNRLYFSGDNQ